MDTLLRAIGGTVLTVFIIFGIACGIAYVTTERDLYGPVVLESVGGTGTISPGFTIDVKFKDNTNSERFVRVHPGDRVFHVGNKVVIKDSFFYLQPKIYMAEEAPKEQKGK